MDPQLPHLLGTSPFMAAKGFQWPVFPVQEEKVAVPTVQEHLRSEPLVPPCIGQEYVPGWMFSAAPDYRPGQ